MKYANSAYAERYRQLVGNVRDAERKAVPGSERLAWAVARGGYRMMAIKDEYEVARLYTDGEFLAGLREAFEGEYT